MVYDKLNSSDKSSIGYSFGRIVTGEISLILFKFSLFYLTDPVFKIIFNDLVQTPMAGLFLGDFLKLCLEIEDSISSIGNNLVVEHLGVAIVSTYGISNSAF